MNTISNGILGKEYQEHKIFEQLSEFAEFYNDLSDLIFSRSTPGTTSVINLDTYFYSSIHGTLESIKNCLKNGRINDGYALLRKYYDSTIINVYSNLYLSDEVSIKNFIVAKIDNWLRGTETIPEYRIISKYIQDSPKLSGIVGLIKKDNRYKKIRERCNDHTHYNFFQNMLLNNNKIILDNRLESLSILSSDLENVFIQHFSYIFYLNDHYMASTDYIDHLEYGLKPEEDSQFWVAPFIQSQFDKYIKAKRPDIAEELINKTTMQLQ